MPAWMLARSYHLAMMPGAGRRARLLVDWNIGLLFGRDTAELGRLGEPRSLGASLAGAPAAEVNSVTASPRFSYCEFVVRLRHIGCVSLAALTMIGLDACGGDDDSPAASAPATTANSAAASGEQRVVRDVVPGGGDDDRPGRLHRVVHAARCSSRTSRGARRRRHRVLPRRRRRAGRDLADDRRRARQRPARLRPTSVRAAASLPFKSATLGLRKSGGKWKVSRLKGGVLDRPAFFRVLRRRLAEPARPASGRRSWTAP